jgi:hypothetical protein
MRSELFGENVEAGTQDWFALQNPRLLRIALGGEVMARQGSMVAYQGELDFAYQGAGGMGRFLKKALTGEGVPLMKVSGRGDLFLAEDADEIHLITLEGDSVTVNGRNVLAFDSTLTWDTKRVEGASMLSRRILQHGLHRDRPGRDHSPWHARGADGGRSDVRGPAGGRCVVLVAHHQRAADGWSRSAHRPRLRGGVSARLLRTRVRGGPGQRRTCRPTPLALTASALGPPRGFARRPGPCDRRTLRSTARPVPILGHA